MTVRTTQSAPLRNTFGLRARAGVLIETDDAADLPDLFVRELAERAPLVIGGGSNLLIVENPDLAFALATHEIRTLSASEDIAIVRADAGVEWHRLVMWSLEQDLAGLENLALIPGTVGAAPIQNIGAYGVEIAQCIHAVEAFERATGTFHRFDPARCAFAYRDSVFKQELDRYLIVAVEFALPTARSVGVAGLNVGYAGIADEMGIASGARTAYTAHDVAEAVIRLRTRKLPDPAIVGNAGSFFKNPIVPAAQAEALKTEFATLPVFSAGDATMRKLSAAWLIDACGWKGKRYGASGDAGVSDKHALVLVNHGHATGAELLALARDISADVHARFGVAIEPEPRVVGATW
jgi:UDP-N-acetylmuramate dehydrogenase